jgi:ectoine hydroxylase-related dioxygenase (phytanoyl-CoA dioxygenase family)
LDKIAEYLEKGIIRIPNVFTAAECERIKTEAYATSDASIVEAGYNHAPAEYKNNRRALIFFPALANRYLNSIRIDARLSSLVKQFIGLDVKQINNQIYFREAGDGDQFAWHRDSIFRESANFKRTVSDDYFQTIIAVDDITESNGAIEFIEGSHRWEHFKAPSDLRRFERNELYGTKYTANRGDVLIWSVNIVHGSEPNVSTQNRMTYMNGFCRAASVDAYPDYLVGGHIVSKIRLDQLT